MTSAEHRPPPPGPKGLIFQYMHPCAISWIVSNISSITLIIGHHIWNRSDAIRILRTQSGNGIGNSSNKSQSKKICFVVLFLELTECRAHSTLRTLLEYVQEEDASDVGSTVKQAQVFTERGSVFDYLQSQQSA